jgi:hypothetical protein
VPVNETYSPRKCTCVGVRDVARRALKVYWLSAYGSPPVAEHVAAALVAAAEVLRDADDDPAPGFVIAHKGRRASWISVSWWTQGDSLSHKYFAYDAATATARPVDGAMIACVWELGIVGFERDAYVESAFGDGDAARYLELRLDGEI